LIFLPLQSQEENSIFKKYSIQNIQNIIRITTCEIGKNLLLL
jgi:hypothetical protein